MAGWKDGSMGKGTGCSYGGPVFNSQHPYDRSQLSVNLVPGDLTRSSVGTSQTGSTQTCRENTYTYKIEL